MTKNDTLQVKTGRHRNRGLHDPFITVAYEI
jgi:hypothetical protein